MGAGIWRTDVYEAAASYRAKSGTSAFAYSDSMTRSGRSTWKVHESLDPAGVVRESRDSEEHPTSTPIAVLFDVTGSMRNVPRQLQERLPDLLELLTRKGYVEHPQILFGAIGDANSDRVPLQVGQFESDNRMDEHLGNILLEGGGGGTMSESYELAMYFMARQTATDAWEKRSKKGYLFIIGDELAYPSVSGAQLEAVLGKESESVALETVMEELNQRWNTYFLLPSGSSYSGNTQVLNFWRELLGQNVIELDDISQVCETIGLTVGLMEGEIELHQGLAELSERERSGSKLASSLAGVGASAGARRL